MDGSGKGFDWMTLIQTPRSRDGALEIKIYYEKGEICYEEDEQQRIFTG